MPQKGPHISIQSESLVNRVLHINNEEFEEWPEGVRRLAIEVSEELFLVRYNPFVNPDTVKQSVQASFELARRGLDVHYANTISEGITMFWSAHNADQAFRKEIIARLSEILPKESIDLRPASRVENATDATDLRLELPLLVVTPASAEEVAAVVRLANEMQFALIPRGGGSGLTGGAIPARKRSVVMALTRLDHILEIDVQKRTLKAEAGVATIDAINAVSEKGLLFSVDPASKTASSIGGNVSENSGGPLAVEYGTTVDNLLSWRMVVPTGEIVEVTRKDHPRHKIEEDDSALFEVRDLSGGLRNQVSISGAQLRKPGLGKDVTDKVLRGLPGVQKEGTDGIIIDATFILHPKLKHERVIVLEFFGRSMHNATLAINKIMALRNEFKAAGDLVKLTMLEEFNSKYVQAIEYRKKSSTYEGEPISVLIVQLDSDDADLADRSVRRIAESCQVFDGVDVFVAEDEKQAELYWEDRHKLSAIAKRTSGFKVNEDIVIPIAALPEFALFLEQLNIECMAGAYRRAMQAVGQLPGVEENDKEFNREFTYASRLIKGEKNEESLSDTELQLHAVLFLRSQREKYPSLADKIGKIEDRMLASQIVVASHMHAGDGNCHVNIPVNSGDPEMLAEAYHVADKVMAKAKELGGEISGEHGVGITKIAFQDDEKIREMREFKELIDPRNIINPAKLTRRELPVAPFTFSFNRLIGDLRQSGLPGKESLIELLTKVQICTRCGKCKEVCAMHYPGAGMYYYPRNRNISLGAIIEAIYYSQVNEGRPDQNLLRQLSEMIEHCTGCGRCLAVCPVKIDSAEVALALRTVLMRENAGGHAIKNLVLNWLVKDPALRIPRAARLAAVGQKVQNRVLNVVPAALKSKFENPLFSAPGPEVGYLHLVDAIRLDKGALFTPKGQSKGTLLYFPGCSGNLFFRSIGLAGILLALRAGWSVLTPAETMCCGYPLLAAGLHDAFALNQDRNIEKLRGAAEKAAALGHPVSRVVTACGSCREGLERHFLPEVFGRVNAAALADSALEQIQPVRAQDVSQLLLEELDPLADAPWAGTQPGLYHVPCHAEWTGVNKKKAGPSYAKAINKFAGTRLKTSGGCCGESGMGALSSPAIYNKLRQRKLDDLRVKLADLPADSPILVGCPSCKMGILRSTMLLRDKRPVLHTLEYLGDRILGPDWRAKGRKLLRGAENRGGLREADMDSLSGLTLSLQDKEADE